MVTLNISREVFRRWYLAIATVGFVIIATLLLPEDTLPVSSDGLIWLSYLSLYVVYSLHQVTDSRPRGSLIGLPLALLSSFLSLGIVPTFALLIAGSTLSSLIQYLLPPREYPRVVISKYQVILNKGASELVTMGISLLAGMGVYALINGQYPLSELRAIDLLKLAILMAVTMSARDIVRRFLNPPTDREISREEIVFIASYDILIDSLLSIPAVMISVSATRGALINLTITLWVLVMAAVVLRAVNLSRASLNRRIEELALLNIVSKALAATSNTSELFRAIYGQVNRLLDAPVFYIALRDSSGQYITFPMVVKNNYRLQWPSRPVGDGPTEVILEQQRTMLSLDGTERMFQHKDSPFADLSEPCCAFVGVPIRTPEGLNGVLAVQHPTMKGAYTEDDASLLETIAAQATTALRNTSLLDMSRQFSEGLMSVNHVSNIINASLETDVILQQICTVSQELSSASSSAIFLKSDETQQFMSVYSIELDASLLLALEKSTSEQMESWAELLSKPEAVAITDIETDPRTEWLKPHLASAGLVSMIITPFISVRNLINERTLSPIRDLIGFQITFYLEPHTASQNEQNLMQMLANQAAVAIENANLFEETQSTVRRLAYLAEATRIFTESLEMDKVAQTVVDWIVDALALDTATLAIWDKAEMQLQVRAHARGYQAPLNIPMPDLAATALNLFPEARQSLQGRWSHVFPASDESLSPAMRQVFDQTGLKTLTFTPLAVRDEVIGLLALGIKTAKALPSSDINLAESIASQAATALQNAQFYAMTETQLSERITEITVLEKVLRSMSASVDEHAIIEDVLDAAYTVTSADMVSCALTTKNQTLEIIWRFADNPLVLHQQEYNLPAHGIIGQVLERGEAITINDTGQSDAYWKPEGSAHNFNSEICVPIMHQGVALGVLNLESVIRNRFQPSHLRFLQNLSGHAAIALERARLFASNQRQIELLDSIRVLSLDLLNAPDMDTVLTQVCVKALDIVQGVNIHVYFYNRDTDSLQFATSLWRDGRRDVEIARPRRDGLTFQGIRTGKPVISDEFIRIPGVSSSRLGIFPILHHGDTVGVLNVAVDDPANLGENEVRALELLTNQAASAIERVRLAENRQKQIMMLEELRRNSVELLVAMELDQLLAVVCHSALIMVQAKNVNLFFYNQEQDSLTFAANLLSDGRQNVKIFEPRPNGLTYTTARSGEIQIATPDDLTTLQREDATIGSVVSIPLRHSDQVVGVLNVAVQDIANLSEDSIRALQLLANQSAAAILNTRLYNEVRSGRDQMQAILNTARDAIALVGPHGAILQANPAVERLLDVDMRALVGKNVLEMVRHGRQNYLGDDVRHPVNIKQIWRSILDNPLQITSREVTIDIRGQKKYLAEQSVPVLAENDELIGRLFVWHDVTEARRLDAARTELTNTIVHDLRSPLTAIKGGLNMLPDMLQDPDDLEIALEIVQIAENSADGLLNLVESLLDVARLENGELPLEIDTVPLEDPLTQAVQILEVLARDSAVSLETNLSADLPLLPIDEDKIRRVLVNLIDNALHYTPQGGRVVISARRFEDDPAVIRVSVEDNGPGIPPDIRDHIFTPFTTGVTGQPTKRHRGLGLGLTFCKLAVEAHGGRIWVDDSAEGGAAFHFTLPIAS